MRRHGPRAPSQGFTLIEMLVALTLMALLSILLFGGLRFGMRAWEAGGDHVEQAGRIEAVQNLLRRQLGQARLPPRVAGNALFSTFAGETDELIFVAPFPVRRGIGGSYLFRLNTLEHDGQMDLVLAWQVYRPEGYTESLVSRDEPTTLIENIAGIEVSYYGAIEPEQPMQWWDAWDSANGMPRMVRMRVDFPSGDTRRWPDLLIRVSGSVR